jgi:uncharacterized protein (TIGR03083 family)
VTAADAMVTDAAAALRNSHERLTRVVEPMTPAELSAQSYDDDWSIAQVLGHLGSQAEIFTAFFEAGLRGSDAPGVEQFKPVWDKWNAKDPQQQASDALATNAAFLDQISALNEEERASWTLSLFGGEKNLGDLVRLRLGEHAVHTWDVVVVADKDAAIAHDAVELIIDNLGDLVARVGQARDETLTVHVSTDAPERRFRLAIGPDGATLQPAETGAEDTTQTEGSELTLRLPAEAFVRLLYGRLDDAHTPPLSIDRADLDMLRRTFPGV